MIKESFFYILLALSNIVSFFFLTKKLFASSSTSLFLTLIFSILPWQTQPDQLKKSKIIALLLLNVLFLIIYRNKKPLNFKKSLPFFILFLLPLLILTIPKLQAENLPFPPNEQDIGKIALYRSSLNPVNPTFSRFYSNKASVVLGKMERNFFESVDINNYFFATHPLERVGVKETEKFFSSLLPLFIVGLFFLKLANDSPLILWAVFLFLAGTLLSNRYFETNLLLIPSFLLVIGRGFERLMAIKTVLIKTVILLPLFAFLVLEIIVFGLR